MRLWRRKTCKDCGHLKTLHDDIGCLVEWDPSGVPTGCGCGWGWNG